MPILYQFNRPNLLNPRHATSPKKLKGMGLSKIKISLKMKLTRKEMIVQMSTAINLMIDIVWLAITRFQSMICRREVM